MPRPSSNAAAIYVERGQHLLIRDCVLSDSGNGLFIGAFDGDTQDVRIEGNWIHGNGNVGSGFEHNTYTAAIGIVYAALLIAIWGLGWARHPTPGPAILFSLLLLAAPFLVMQPGMGLGIAASKTPDPTASRLRSVINHTVFGLGLFVSALVGQWLIP